MLKKNDKFPNIQSIPMPPNVTVGGIQATTDSLLAVEFEYENNTFVTFINATVIEQENVTASSESSNKTVATSFNETFTLTSIDNIIPSTTCKWQTLTVTEYVMVITSVMMSVSSDSITGIDATVTSRNNSLEHDQANQEIVILLVLILIVLMVMIVFAVLIAFFKCKQC